MRPRIEEELVLLRRYYPEIVYKEHAGEDWFQIPRYLFPAGWQINGIAVSEASIVFKISAAYPTAEPYGFSTPSGISFCGNQPQNAGPAAGYPFEGGWQHFSWAPDGWTPTADLRKWP